MKKTLLLGLFLALSGLVWGQWTEFNSPSANISTVCVSDQMVYLFGDNQYYEAIIPSPGQSPLWQTKDLPNEQLVREAIVLNEQLFILLTNGELWRRANSDWQLTKTDLKCLVANSAYLYACSTNNTLWKYEQQTGQWEFFPSFLEVKDLAVNDQKILLFTETVPGYCEVYIGDDINSEFIHYNSVEMAISEVALSNSEIAEYIMGGQSDGYISWYITPLEGIAKWIHVLSVGITNSVLIKEERAWMAGLAEDSVGNSKGFIMNPKDITSIFISPEPVLKIRGNQNFLCAFSASKIYLYWPGNSSSIQDKSGQDSNFSISPNPVFNGVIRIKARTAGELRIYSLSGKLVEKLFIPAGEQTIPLNLAPGMYFFNHQKVIVQ